MYTGHHAQAHLLSSLGSEVDGIIQIDVRPHDANEAWPAEVKQEAFELSSHCKVALCKLSKHARHPARCVGKMIATSCRQA